FVLGRDAEAAHAAPDTPQAAFDSAGRSMESIAPARLIMDSTSAPDLGQGDTIGRFLSDIVQDNPDKIVDYTRTWPHEWREAGTRWLSADGWKPEAQCVVP